MEDTGITEIDTFVLFTREAVAHEPAVAHLLLFSILYLLFYYIHKQISIKIIINKLLNNNCLYILKYSAQNI